MRRKSRQFIAVLAGYYPQRSALAGEETVHLTDAPGA